MVEGPGAVDYADVLFTSGRLEGYLQVVEGASEAGGDETRDCSASELGLEPIFCLTVVNYEVLKAVVEAVLDPIHNRKPQHRRQSALVEPSEAPMVGVDIVHKEPERPPRLTNGLSNHPCLDHVCRVSQASADEATCRPS